MFFALDRFIYYTLKLSMAKYGHCCPSLQCITNVNLLTNLKETVGIQRIRKITLLKKIISEIEINCRLQYILVKKIISEIKNSQYIFWEI